MELVKVVKYDGAPDTMVWKYPFEELGTWTQLIVNESQEVLFFKGGQALDLFGPGRHTLSTENIPILSNLVNIPFGGRSPFTAEVWFVNKTCRLDIKWGTQSPIQLQDPKYQLLVGVRAFGQMGIQVEDTRKFLLKLIGTQTEMTQNELSQYFRGILMMNVKELISSYLIFKKISLLEINAYLSEISIHVQERVAAVFSEYGLRLAGFAIESINTPEDDPSTKRLKDALAKKAEMDIIGYNYQQERTFNTYENAAKNEGNVSPFMGAGIGLSLGREMGTALGVSFGSQATLENEKPLQQKEEAKIIPCSNCRQPIPTGSKFCPECGDAYRPCPRCQADNPADAQVCMECGASFGLICIKCGATNETGKFCRECGASLVLTCSQCQTAVQPGQKFCFECGNKLI
ncbi:SPFH domain-containing protein [Gorillibacterium massiliense]|uniref:SPFH domain-containing protein n=1 Tax=Gorillibacterium massiliense TaxID=1280390 RepID=UPI0004ADCBDD|nr:SPFH domain-containing protein [Gorillibacterium massiliense]